MAGAFSPLPAARGLEATGRRSSQWCLRKKSPFKKGERKRWGRNWVPGLRGPATALRVGPTPAAACGGAALPPPTARSVWGLRPKAPAAPRSLRAAVVTGGGGRGDPGGLGVGRPGGREAGVRAAAPPLGLSLLSIPYLMSRHTDQHPRSRTATLTVEMDSGTLLPFLQLLHPWAPKPQSGPGFIFLAHPRPLTSLAAQPCPQIPHPLPFPKPRSPAGPPPSPQLPFRNNIHAPTPRPSGTR